MGLSGTALHIALVTDQERRITEKKRVGHKQSIIRQERDADAGPGGPEASSNSTRTKRHHHRLLSVSLASPSPSLHLRSL